MSIGRAIQEFQKYKPIKWKETEIVQKRKNTFKGYYNFVKEYFPGIPKVSEDTFESAAVDSVINDIFGISAD